MASTRAISIRTWLGRRGIYLAFVLLLAFNAAVTPNFLELQTLYINLTQVATIAIVAIGMTLVIAGGGIDLSVGAVMALAGALGPYIFLSEWGAANPGPALALSFALPMAVAAACGLFNGTLVCFFRIQPIVATLILFISGRGLGQVLTNGNLQVFTNPGFSFIGTGRLLGLPVQALIVAAVVALAYWLVRHTLFGRYLLAIGGNERSARLAGVPVAKVKLLTYVFCGAGAGVAGLIVSAINSASDANLTGLFVELDAIAAAVVGGTLLTGGKAPIFGTLVGAMIIQLIRYTLLANGVPDAVSQIAKATIIIAAVCLHRRRTD